MASVSGLLRYARNDETGVFGSPLKLTKIREKKLANAGKLLYSLTNAKKLVY
jgi:hypothetical protein